jgi:tetratricopeptide (TPR) repeat protein
MVRMPLRPLFVATVMSIALVSTAWAQPKKDDKTIREEFEPDDTAQSGPTSKVLQQAKERYDKGDYAAASVEFDKVVRGQTNDSEANKQKAEFFLGKTLFHMKYYAASMKYFDGIVQKGNAHKYHQRTLQWLAALAKVLPESAGILKKIGTYPSQDLESPVLEPVRAELYYLLGRHYYLEGQLDQAIATLRKVPRDSEFFPKSKYLEAVCWVLVPKGAEAVAALKEILLIAAEEGLRKKYPADEVAEFSERAELTMARVFYSTKQFKTSIRYFEKIPMESPDWLNSLFEASWAYFMIKNNSKALGNIHTLNAPYFENEFFPESVILKAQIYFNYCLYDQAMESVAEFNGLYPPVRDDLRKLVAKDPDDNSAFYEGIKKIRKGEATDLSADTQRIAGSALQDKTLLKTFTFVDELERELEQYEDSGSWKGTPIAADVQEHLTLQKSLAEDAAGTLARERLGRLEKELTAYKSDAAAVKIETLRARVGTKRRELAGQEISKGKEREEPIIVDDEHHSWSFNGEYWKDELGYYRYRIASKCPAR